MIAHGLRHVTQLTQQIVERKIQRDAQVIQRNRSIFDSYFLCPELQGGADSTRERFCVEGAGIFTKREGEPRAREAHVGQADAPAPQRHQTERALDFLYAELEVFCGAGARGKPHSPELKPPAQQVDVRAVDFREQTRGLFQARLEG